MFGFRLPASSVPKFRPDTGGGGELLFGLLVPSRCREGLVLLSPLRCSGSRLLYIARALRCARFQLSGVPKSANQKAAPAICAFPVRAAQAARSLTGALFPGAAWLLPSAVPASVPARDGRVLAPSALCVPSLSPHPGRSGAYALCLPATLPADVDPPEPQEVFD